MNRPILRAAIVAGLTLGMAACQSESDNALAALDNALLEEEAAENATASAPLARDIVVDPKLAQGGNPAAGGAAAAAADTPGALAQGRRSTGNCATNVDYSPRWAERLPADLPMIPNSRLVEAAGNATPDCALRVVNFTTDLALPNAIDWYRARATKAGYSAELQRDGAQHVLGGVRARDGAAYVVFLSERQGGGTDIDLVANKGA